MESPRICKSGRVTMIESYLYERAVIPHAEVLNRRVESLGRILLDRREDQLLRVQRDEL